MDIKLSPTKRPFRDTRRAFVFLEKAQALHLIKASCPNVAKIAGGAAARVHSGNLYIVFLNAQEFVWSKCS